MNAPRFDAELWIGACYWPIPSESVSLRELCRWEAIGFDYLRVGGSHCHLQEFFGLVLHVPAKDDLARVASEYYSSNLPGNWDPEQSTPTPTVMRMVEKVEELELEMDSRYYAKSAEAYLPLEFKSAWAYSRRRQLKVFRFLDDEASMISPAVLGLRSADDVSAFLKTRWKTIQEELKAGPLARRPPESWTAVLHYPNSE